MAKDKNKTVEKAQDIDAGLVELTNGTETVRAHPSQVAHWGTQGFFPIEAEPGEEA